MPVKRPTTRPAALWRRRFEMKSVVIHERLMSWLLLFVAFGSFAGVVYHALRVRLAAGKGMPEYSLLGEDYNGLSAAGALLQKLNWEPVALTRPIQHSEQ